MRRKTTSLKKTKTKILFIDRHLNYCNMKSKLFILTTSFILLSLSVIGQDIQSVQVDQLNDSQVQQIMQEIEARGLTIEQAATLAKARGASQLQIDQMLSRFRQLGSSSIQTSSASENTFSITDSASFQVYTKEQLKEVSDLNKRIFGHQLFNADNLSFEPSMNISVPENYALGVGDQVQVNVWGSSQQTYVLTVNRNGTILIPDLGPILVSGKDFKQVRQLILKRLTAIYSDMGGSTPGTFADISINNIRPISVHVIGEAIAPGTYTVPATASAFNALYLSGGPNENGSFRNIKLIREDETLKVIDVYDYLINGNTEENILLRDQDILLIPSYEKRAELTGAFKRTGIFEVKDEESLDQLIRFAGGFGKGAYQKKLSVTRFSDKQHQLIDVYQDQFAGFGLQNGDSIHAGMVIERFQNRISIEGAVFRPGEYGLSEGMTLSQLIQKAEGIREDHYANRGLIIRLDDQLFPTTIAFDVDEVINGRSDIPLQREDQVFIHDIFNIGEEPFLNIFGEVMSPGKFDYSKNMTLRDLILLAGGFTEAASQSYIEVARRNNPEEAASISHKMVSLFQFSIDRKLELNREDQKFILQPFDHIYVRKAPSYFEQKTISIQGEVKYPGQYSIASKTERISDIIKRAGGLTPDAYAQGARLDRNTKSEMEENLELIKTMQQADSLSFIEQKVEISRLELKLSEIIKQPGSHYDYTLREGDKIYIPKKTDEIWVTGEVLNPIGQAWKKGKRLKYYINRSGGFSTNAKKGKVYIIYSDGTTEVTKSLLGRKYPRPMPGCQVVIPAKPIKAEGDNTTRWLSIASAFSSIAIAIAAVLK